MILSLKGHYAGKTVKLAGTQFIDGEAEVPDAETSRIRVLERYYGAHGISQPQKSPARTDSKDDPVPSDPAPPEQGPASVPTDDGKPAAGSGESPADGGSGLASDGDGLQYTGVSETVMRFAIQKLDPNNDDHWMITGAPQTKVIQKMLKKPKITSKLIKSLCPHDNRASVRQIKD